MPSADEKEFRWRKCSETLGNVHVMNRNSDKGSHRFGFGGQGIRNDKRPSLH